MDAAPLKHNPTGFIRRLLPEGTAAPLLSAGKARLGESQPDPEIIKLADGQDTRLAVRLAFIVASCAT